MSATPEQIAAGLDEFAGEQEAKSAEAWLVSMASAYLNEAKQLRAAASLIRAQSEREKVLVEALKPFARNVFGGNQHAEALKQARAALAGAR